VWNAAKLINSEKFNPLTINVPQISEKLDRIIETHAIVGFKCDLSRDFLKTLDQSPDEVKED
jgi:hypothetical protein